MLTDVVSDDMQTVSLRLSKTDLTNQNSLREPQADTHLRNIS
jgi:hypothetical protein